MAVDLRRGMDEVSAILSYGEQFEKIFGKPYHRKFKIDGAPRPRCVCCDNPYGSRITKDKHIVLTATDLPPEEYRSNEPVYVVEQSLDHWGDRSGQPAARVSYRLWDGVSFTAPYAPFCSTVCAVAFAKRAYKEGFR